MNKYQYKEKAGFNVDPQIAGEELERIRERDGMVKTKTVVMEARPKKSPLHPAFEWNNSVAAEKFRENQARQLVRAIVVIRDDAEDPEPAYAHVTVEKEDYYQSPRVAVQNIDEWESMLRQAAVRLHGAQRAFDDLERIAKEKDDSCQAAMLAVAIRALETADNALTKMTH